MGITRAYDDSEEIVKPEIFTRGFKRLPKKAIVFFKKELIEEIENMQEFEEYSETFVSGDAIKIYKTNLNGEDVILYRTLLGGPATVGMMEEMHARGVDNFIFFGSSGEIDSNIKKGAFIIPVEAYRDEGTSYHYVPASDFIKVKTAAKLAEIFDKNNISYEFAKTWTTDAIYKETKNKTKERKELGCKVVEMECASIMAMAEARGINAYQFLYTDDTLEGDTWDLRTLRDNRNDLLKECLKIALEVAKEI